MRNVYDIRRDNLRTLISQWGGPTSLARKLGYANGSYLAQLAGPHPSRDVSEKVAREIEARVRLPVGWLDQEQVGGGRPLDDQGLAECVRAVASVIRDAGLRPPPETYATLAQLAYEHARLTGVVDEAYIKRLVSLLREGGVG